MARNGSAAAFRAPDRAERIAAHACWKYSGRVGRSAPGRRLSEEAVRLAVAAHVRHEETGYDELLGRGTERGAAREHVREQVERVLAQWRGGQRDGGSALRAYEPQPGP